MNKAQAQYAMRHPRRSVIRGNVDPKCDPNPWETWYYVEAGGLDIMVRKAGVGTVAVKITKRQMQQALKLMESAVNG